MKDERAWFLFCSGADETFHQSNDDELETEEVPLSDHNDDCGGFVESDEQNDPIQESYLSDDAMSLLNQRRAELSRPICTETTWEQHSPSLSLILQFDQVMTQRVLRYNVSWLQRSKKFSKNRTSWIYGLLARLDFPLFQDIVATIRLLYRITCTLRASLLPEKVLDVGEEYSEQLASLNLLIVLSGCFFQQGEIYASRSSS
jgi:hypothetical protein